ncbi:hypothetical protein KVR01_007482 [Diaporthe batatas]|uniref:uncharacterized protein n=1 Tax=Diaporthe batatas TaxID=748121 RepID=UPI001D048CF3|nr:uncharacterized protein KVR01_007482 [Diaporthe batatas]KAG8163004.1 hypothetical protein KVR01_007482 [Diaporthe batatas]
MDDTPQSTFSTPKRKRADAAGGDVPSQIDIHFSFDVSQGLLSDGGDSPRTKVAHRFRGLALADSGGGAAAADGPLLHDTEPDPGRHTTHGGGEHEMEVDEDESKMRKRSKLTPPSGPSDEPPQLNHHALSPAAQPQPQPQPQLQLSARRDEIPETPATTRTEPQAAAGPETVTFPPGDRHVLFRPNVPCAQPTPESAPPLADAPAKAPSSKQPKQPPAANNRALESLKTKGRRRSGTPPLVASASKLASADTQPGGDAAAQVIDPIRAALTWHEDEITVYDPDDEDDDGVGINGIGFKPTPAIAYARTMKRRQQLAEYKKREEREARARRSSRRRGSPDRAPKTQRKESAAAENARKVRFTDSEAGKMIST